MESFKCQDNVLVTVDNLAIDGGSNAHRFDDNLSIIGNLRELA